MPPDLPPGFTPGKLGDKVERLLRRAFLLVYDATIGPLGDSVRTGVDNYLEKMEKTLLWYIRPILERILSMPNLPDEFRIPLEKVHNPQGQVELAAVAGVAVGILVGLIQGAVAPVARLASYFVERIVQTGRPDPETLFRMWRRGAFDTALRDSYLDDLGVSDHLKNGFEIASTIRPGISELLTLWLRGHISESEFTTRLQQEGVPSAFVPDIKNLGESIPGPGDLVSFALREAWDDSVAAKYGYDADFAPQFAQEMERHGYKAEWAKRYWRAHWQIPSLTAGFELFQRGIIDRATLENLLKIADYPQFWRDALIKLSYNLYTRVDTRRMYGFGIMSADEVIAAYKEQGYDDEKARKLAQLAIADATEEQRDLTKTDILNGYRDGLLTRDETIDFLVSLRYDRDSAEFLVAKIDQEREQKLIKAELAVMEDLFLNNDLTVTEVQERMAALGIPARQVELSIQEWTIARNGKVKRPSRETLERLYKSGAITHDEFVTTLGDIGYQDKYTNWYVHNIALEQQAQAEKEEERARTERERVEKDRRKTKYQSEKAVLDVDIAETQAAIAANNVALVEAQNERNEALRAMLPLEKRAQIERDYMVIIHDAEAAIGQANIAIADLRKQEKERRERLAELDQSIATNVDIAEQTAIKAAIQEMRTVQAQENNAIAIVETDIARLKAQLERETDPLVQDEIKATIRDLEVLQAEHQEIIAGVTVDIRLSEEQLGILMEPVRRQELIAEQASVRVEIADITTRIANVQAEAATTATAKRDAQNTMEAEITELPGDAQALEIRQHYDSLIERIKAQTKELQVRLAQLRVQKALLTLEYKGT